MSTVHGTLDPSKDPQVIALVADLRAILGRVEELSRRYDRESDGVGALWYVRRHLEKATVAAGEIVALEPDADAGVS